MVPNLKGAFSFKGENITRYGIVLDNKVVHISRYVNESYADNSVEFNKYPKSMDDVLTYGKGSLDLLGKLSNCAEKEFKNNRNQIEKSIINTDFRATLSYNKIH